MLPLQILADVQEAAVTVYVEETGNFRFDCLRSSVKSFGIQFPMYRNSNFAVNENFPVLKVTPPSCLKSSELIRTAEEALGHSYGSSDRLFFAFVRLFSPIFLELRQTCSIRQAGIGKKAMNEWDYSLLARMQ